MFDMDNSLVVACIIWWPEVTHMNGIATLSIYMCVVFWQYQKALNRSIEKMRAVFNDFEDEGWEEIQESEEM